MKTNWALGTAAALTVLASAASAAAQERTRDETKEEGAVPSLAPVRNAVELTMGTGYEGAFGKFSSALPALRDLGGTGGALQLGIGYRLIPQLAVGLYGSGAVFGRGEQVDPNASLFSGAMGAQADWHFLPDDHRLDPWVSLGAGWRGYWIDQTVGNVSIQGWEIAKLQVGLDFRLAQALAISPVVGADLSTFFTESPAGSRDFHNIPSPQVSTFLFAGVMGRFDIPTRTSESEEIASR